MGTPETGRTQGHRHFTRAEADKERCWGLGLWWEQDQPWDHGKGGVKTVMGLETMRWNQGHLRDQG